MRVHFLLFLCTLAWLATGCASSDKAAYSAPSSPPYQNAELPYGGIQTQRTQQASYDVNVLQADSSPRAMASNAESGSTASSPQTEAQKIDAQRASAKSQPQAERKLVRHAWMTLEVDDVDDFPRHIQTFHTIAKSLDGYVQSESSSTLTMMVPTERIEQALTLVAQEGKTTYKNISVVDATSSYVDMNIRIENLKKMRVRLTELVNQSTSVQEVLEVERELARVTSELERVEGQMRLLSMQTSYATINLTLEERVKPGPLGWIFYGIGRGVKWLFIRN